MDQSNLDDCSSAEEARDSIKDILEHDLELPLNYESTENQEIKVAILDWQNQDEEEQEEQEQAQTQAPEEETKS